MRTPAQLTGRLPGGGLRGVDVGHTSRAHCVIYVTISRDSASVSDSFWYALTMRAWSICGEAVGQSMANGFTIFCYQVDGWQCLVLYEQQKRTSTSGI